jgi:hypothetical protein
MKLSTIKPEDYVELVLDIATVITANDRQSMITFEQVGGTTMYCIGGGDKVDRHPDEDAPGLSVALTVTEFYGEALRVARRWVGWAWVAHPNKTKDMP